MGGTLSARARARSLGLALLLLLLPMLSACVSVAEFRKLEFEFNKLKKQNAVGSDSRATVADLAHELERIHAEIASLGGRLDVVAHQSKSALEEARAARQAAHGAASRSAGPGDGDGELAGATESASPEEVGAYRQAYSAWRSGDNAACIDRFREFLQTHASSEYADDAAYWMADCHFKQGDYRTAVLRFDDVVGRYPTGNKAADALFRQGEALLRLGYGEAAVKAFERVVNEYPDSVRATEAKRQVDLLRRAG